MYRDDLEAARQRIAALEQELQARDAEIADLRCMPSDRRAGGRAGLTARRLRLGIAAVLAMGMGVLMLLPMGQEPPASASSPLAPASEPPAPAVAPASLAAPVGVGGLGGLGVLPGQSGAAQPGGRATARPAGGALASRMAATAGPPVSPGASEGIPASGGLRVLSEGRWKQPSTPQPDRSVASGSSAPEVTPVP